MGETLGETLEGTSVGTSGPPRGNLWENLSGELWGNLSGNLLGNPGGTSRGTSGGTSGGTSRGTGSSWGTPRGIFRGHPPGESPRRNPQGRPNRKQHIAIKQPLKSTPYNSIPLNGESPRPYKASMKSHVRACAWQRRFAFWSLALRARIVQLARRQSSATAVLDAEVEPGRQGSVIDLQSPSEA